MSDEAGQPADPPLGPPIRVGVAVAAEHGPAWVADVIRTIRESDSATLAAVVVTGRARRRPTVADRLLGVYTRVDGRVFGRSDDPTRMVDVGGPLDGIARVALDGRHGLDGTALDGSAVDVWLRLDASGGVLGGDPALGTWTIEHDGSIAASDDPWIAPSATEVLTGRRSTISRLVATTATGRHVLGEVASRVDRLSVRRGARGHLTKLPGLVERSLAAARTDGVLPEPIAAPPAPRARPLSAVGVMRGAAGVVAAFAGRWTMRRLAPERWVVAVARTDHPLPILDGRLEPAGFRILAAPAGREWADPFPVATADRDLLFVEEYVRDAHRGRLLVVELDDSKRGWRSAEPILDLPTHLSYPFTFEWAGARYLLPEQAATGSLELYVADPFPTTWRHHSTPLPGIALADPTIACIDGRWWLFGARTAEGGRAADELHVYHADTPLGPWTPHRRNPVVSDIRTGRPAGRLFEHEGAWYRPSQDGAIDYGHSIAIARIDRLDPDAYQEHVVRTIRPSWLPGLIGTHTINVDGRITAIDGLVREPRLGRHRVRTGRTRSGGRGPG